MDKTNKKFQVIVKNVHNFYGKNVVDFFVGHEKISTSLNIYDKAVLRVLLGESQPPAAVTGDSNAANRQTVGDTSNEDFYNVFFFTTKGATCSVARCFAGKTLGDGSGHGRRAWVALREYLTAARGKH